MYHIPDNKRAKDSAYKIYKSTRNILLTKKLVDITVMDIKNDSGIARSTFYRLFDNVADVLEMQFEIFFDKFLEQRKKEKDKILYFYIFFNKHSDLVYILSHQYESIIKKIIQKKMEKSSDIYDEYLVSYISGVMTSLLCKWTERGKKESPAMMASITRKLMNMNVSSFISDEM